MQSIAPTTSTTPTLPPVAGSGGASQAAGAAGALGSTALPKSGPSQDALIAALSQLVTVLRGLIDALTGAAAVGGGPAATCGDAPAQQTPGQSPQQQPVDPTVTPVVGGGGAIETLKPVDASYDGPYMSSDKYLFGNDAYSTSMHSGSRDFGSLGRTSAHLHFMGRGTDGGVSPDNGNRVPISGPGVPIGTEVALPDSGTVTLSTGATFAWSPRWLNTRSGAYNDMQFSVARGGQPLTFNGGTVDQVDGFGEKVSSPLTSHELAELVRTLANRYPAYQRW